LLSSFCCSFPVLFQFFPLHWGMFLFLNVVWKVFVNVKLLGIDNNNGTFVFSNGHNYSQQIISLFFRIALYTRTLGTWSFPVPTERSLISPCGHICFESVHWMWETLVTQRGKKSNQHVTWTLETLLNERLLGVLMGIVEGALL